MVKYNYCNLNVSVVFIFSLKTSSVAIVRAEHFLVSQSFLFATNIAVLAVRLVHLGKLN